MRKTISVLLNILVIILLLLGYVGYSRIKTLVKEVKYEVKEDKIYATVNIKGYNKNTYCIYNDEKIKVKNNKCTFEVPNEKSKIIITNKYNEKEEYLLPSITKVLSFDLDEYKTYLHINERKTVEVSVTSLGSPMVNTLLTSSDENVVKTENNQIIGVGNGKATVTVSIGELKRQIEVIVTNLIHLPVWEGQNKSLLPCNIYSDDDARLLDEFLDYEIKKVGENTRMAAVVAARFLTLELPYRVPYFYENGRVSNTGVHFVDGEGRYYKKGMYLGEYKKNDIIATWKGPAVWGCPLMNLEDDKLNGYYPGTLKPNGLDCSGFISWAIRQAGFDPGDNGAGENPENPYQMTDLGHYTKLTRELVYSGTIKVGDLFNYWGHIAMLVGIHDGKYYIAESLMGPRFDGATVKEYTFENVTNTFGYVVLMDDYYKEDGKYSEYWE